MVKRSRRPWVGCSWEPSPALMTEHFTLRARRWGAPEDLWRMMMASTPMASMLRAVSRRVSPLETEEVETEKSRTSAESRWAASEKEVLVRVESSKKRLTQIFPRRAGTFLMERVETSLSVRAVSRMERISSAERDSRSRRLERFQVRVSSFEFQSFKRGDSSAILLRGQIDGVFGIGRGQVNDDFLVGTRGIDFEAGIIGGDGKFALAAVDQDGEADEFGAAEVDEGVEGSSDGAAGFEDIIAEDDGTIIESEVHVRALGDGDGAT